MKNETKQLVTQSELSTDTPSKTKRKEQMHELQHLGTKLIELTTTQLQAFNLPDQLFDAIVLAKRLSANGAIRRQNQYIGKLMRMVDPVFVKDKLDEINGESAKSVAKMHLVEHWRDQIIKSDEKLTEFINTYPKCVIQELRNLVKIVRLEIERQQNRNYRKLFQFIRNIIEENS